MTRDQLYAAADALNREAIRAYKDSRDGFRQGLIDAPNLSLQIAGICEVLSRVATAVAEQTPEERTWPTKHSPASR